MIQNHHISSAIRYSTSHTIIIVTVVYIRMTAN